MNCTLCETHLINQIDDFYFICDGCGAYVKDRKFYFSPEDEKSQYDEHNNDVNDPRYQKFVSPITNAVLEMQSPEHWGLDYGCGPGPVIASVLRKSGFQILLYDPFYHPDESVLIRQYDYIVSCEVFEHFYRPKHEIEKLLTLLKPKGRLYVMTHLYTRVIDFSKWYYRKDMTHVFIYTHKTMDYIAANFQLDLISKSDRFQVFQKA